MDLSLLAPGVVGNSRGLCWRVAEPMRMGVWIGGFRCCKASRFFFWCCAFLGLAWCHGVRSGINRLVWRPTLYADGERKRVILA